MISKILHNKDHHKENANKATENDYSYLADGFFVLGWAFTRLAMVSLKSWFMVVLLAAVLLNVKLAMGHAHGFATALEPLLT